MLVTLWTGNLCHVVKGGHDETAMVGARILLASSGGLWGWMPVYHGDRPGWTGANVSVLLFWEYLPDEL